MSGDLEDFLKRAAARRQQNQARRPASPPSRPRPEYTTAERERTVQIPDDDEEILMGEIVAESPPAGSRRPTSRRSTTARPERPLRPAPVSITAVPSDSEGSVAPITDAGPTAHSANAPASKTVAELIQALRTPDGIRQAILVREILDRPEHRW